MHVVFERFMYENIRNVYINKLPRYFIQGPGVQYVKITQENSLVVLGKYLFFAAQMRQKRKCSIVYVLRLCFACYCSFLFVLLFTHNCNDELVDYAINHPSSPTYTKRPQKKGKRKTPK